jgi:hypothetical protein
MLGFGDSGYWAAYVDLSPRYAGLLLGVGNTLGNFAGIMVNLSTGLILDACKKRHAVLSIRVRRYSRDKTIAVGGAIAGRECQQCLQPCCRAVALFV